MLLADGRMNFATLINPEMVSAFPILCSLLDLPQTQFVDGQALNPLHSLHTT